MLTTNEGTIRTEYAQIVSEYHEIRAEQFNVYTYSGKQCRRSNMSSTDLLNNHFNNEALACFLNNVTSKDLVNVIYVRWQPIEMV